MATKQQRNAPDHLDSATIPGGRPDRRRRDTDNLPKAILDLDRLVAASGD